MKLIQVTQLLLLKLIISTIVWSRPSHRRYENEIVEKDISSKQLDSAIVLEAKYYQLSANTLYFEDRPGQASVIDSCDDVTGVPLDVADTMMPFGIGRFYQKYTEAYGIPVIGSEYVEDASLRRACYVLRFLLSDRPSLRHAMYKAHSRVAVMAQNEKIRDLPEYDFLPEIFDKSVRALAGTPSIPVTAIGEENLLCFTNDTNRPEDLLVRELAISIFLTAVPISMPKIRNLVEDQYYRAMASGLWEDTLASISPETYLGESVQSFFNVNGYARPPDGSHNQIKTRIQLQFYDNRVFDIVLNLFPCGNNLISRCARRGSEKYQVLQMDCPSHWPPPGARLSRR